MWRIFKWFFATLWSFCSGLALFLFYNWIAGRPNTKLPDFLLILSENSQVLFVAFFVVGLLTILSYQKEQLEQFRRKTWFYKRASKIRLRDVNILLPGSATFLEQPILNNCISLLNQQSNVILVGVPLIGKTRAAYETIKAFPDHWVLALSPVKPFDAAIHRLPGTWRGAKPSVILFLDDLNLFIDRLAPAHLLHELKPHCKSAVVLATCRSGEELDALLKDKLFSDFISQNSTLVALNEISEEAARNLANQLNRPWKDEDFNGTPGAIVYGLSAMNQRLRFARVTCKGLMRSLSLLHILGLPEYRKYLAEATLQKIFGISLTRIELDEDWRWLQEQGFISSDKGGRITPTHLAYLYPDFVFQEDEKNIIPESIPKLIGIIEDGKEPTELLALGRLFYGLNKFERSVSVLRQYVAMLPDDPMGYYRLANVYEADGNLEEAEAQYRNVLQKDPKLPAPYNDLGLILKNTGRAEQAVEMFKRGIELSRDSAALHANLANALKLTGRGEEAEAELRNAVNIDGDLPEVRLGLAHLLLSDDRLDEAEKELQILLDHGIRTVPVLLCLATISHERDKLNEEKSLLEEALQLDASDPEAHRLLGISFVEQERPEMAEKEFRLALEADPSSSARINLAIHLDSIGQIEEALLECRKAVNLHEDTELAIYWLVQILSRNEKHTEAEQELRAALRQSPRSIKLNMLFAGKLLDSDRFPDAAHQFHYCVELDPTNSEAHWGYGRSLEKQSSWEEAEVEFRIASNLNPKDKSSRLGIAVCLSNQGNFKDAEVILRGIVGPDVTGIVARRNLAWVLAETGRKDEAEEEFKKGIEDSVDDHRIRYAYARFLLKQERQADAILVLQEALRCNPDFVEAHQLLDSLSNNNQSDSILWLPPTFRND